MTEESAGEAARTESPPSNLPATAATGRRTAVAGTGRGREVSGLVGGGIMTGERESPAPEIVGAEEGD